MNRCYLVFCIMISLLFLVDKQICYANDEIPKIPLLSLNRSSLPIGEKCDLMLDFVAGQRGFMSAISILVPSPIAVDMEQTTVDVIGRGEVPLTNLPRQSIGYVASAYSYTKVGEIDATKIKEGTLLTFRNIDLRPFNGVDLRLRFKGVSLTKKASYSFEADYIPSSSYNLPSHHQGEAYVAGNERISHKAIVTLRGVEKGSVSLPIADYTKEWNVKQLGLRGDDIVKLGSDCALGFTRPSRNFWIRNIVGDTNCNVFQIGSETADDIQDVYIDNMYVLATNKAGFSISTNDGGCVRNIYLNSGKTGRIHSRSVMRHTRTPFFISISNRGRVLGALATPYRFKENEVMLHELLVTNSNIGKVENIVICDVDVNEVYAGSCYYNGIRWKAYDGTQPESTPIIAGFKLPDTNNVEGGLNFSLPDGRSVGRIKHIEFHRVNVEVKGGHPKQDAQLVPPEIGVGKFNIRDLKVQPAWGFWARHVEDLLIKDCSVSAEKVDGRYPVLLDNVWGAKIDHLNVKEGSTSQKEMVKSVHSKDIEITY